MENTIKNMELAVSKMDQEFERSHYNLIKTLANSYINILRQFSDSMDYCMEKIPYKHELLNQKEALKRLYTKANEDIHSEMKNGEYKNADNLTVIAERIQRGIARLEEILLSEQRYKDKQNKYENLPQNRNKETVKIKNVGIFGLYFASAKEKYEEIRKNINMDDARKEEQRGGKEIVLTTNELKIVARGYSDTARGMRLDEIYVDKNLKITDLHNIQSMKKEKDTPVYYF